MLHRMLLEGGGGGGMSTHGKGLFRQMWDLRMDECPSSGQIFLFRLWMRKMKGSLVRYTKKMDQRSQKNSEDVVS